MLKKIQTAQEIDQRYILTSWTNFTLEDNLQDMYIIDRREYKAEGGDRSEWFW